MYGLEDWEIRPSADTEGAVLIVLKGKAFEVTVEVRGGEARLREPQVPGIPAEWMPTLSFIKVCIGVGGWVGGNGLSGTVAAVYDSRRSRCSRCRANVLPCCRRCRKTT